MKRLTILIPAFNWLRTYDRSKLTSDGMAAVIVTIMLIPQSLAYALLAGVPPEMGLYASILPLVAYALFGTSNTLAVGPVAILSLMTAAAAGRIAGADSTIYVSVTSLLALMAGGFLIAMGALRLGFLANFLSHPVISGFITASGLLIAASQIKHIIGVDAGGHSLLEILISLGQSYSTINAYTFAIGGASLIVLFAIRGGLKPVLINFGMPVTTATLLARTGPVLTVIAGIAVSAELGLHMKGVAIIGDIPTGLPALTLPGFDVDLWKALAGPAAMIALIGFVESVSVAQTLAAKRRERIDPNQELVGLGTASFTSGISGGFPVTGGLARSAVNFDAGAVTPAAGLLTAGGIALATLFLTPYLFYLPKAVLAATIIVAVLSLVDLRALKQTWQYSRNDFFAMLVTTLVTLMAGVELGVISGVTLSLFLHLYRSSRPHFAIVGQVPGTEHFRNIERHDVVIAERILTIRIDESLYFVNAHFLEDTVYELIAEIDGLKELILMCPAVNEIDSSALESLEAINDRLKEAGIRLHLSEVKGPVIDRLKRSDFLEHLTGEIFLNQYQAICALDASALDNNVLKKQQQSATKSLGSGG